MPKLLPRTHILDHKMSRAYTEYVKNNNISKEHRAKGRKELFLIVRTIFKHIAKNLVEKTGGVMISGWGYFFIWKIPRKMSFEIRTRGKEKEEKFNYSTDHHMYSPIFLSSDGTTNMKGWIMDNKFCEKIKSGMTQKIRSGFKYRMYAYSLNKLLKK